MSRSTQNYFAHCSSYTIGSWFTVGLLLWLRWIDKETAVSVGIVLVLGFWVGAYRARAIWK